MEKETRDKIRAAMSTVAGRHGISLRTLSELIQLQIELGLKSPDPAVRAVWRRIPAVGDRPTPEEAIGFLAAVRLGLIK